MGTLRESRMVISTIEVRFKFATARFSRALSHSLLAHLLRAAGVNPESELRRLISGPVDAAPQGDIKILVVEDSLPLRRILEHLLSLEGYQPILAGSVEEAYGVLQNQEVKVVLLNLGLPGASGFELLRLMRRDPRLQTIAVIICSAPATQKDVVHAIQLGANDYVAKPFARSVLLDRKAGPAAHDGVARRRDTSA